MAELPLAKRVENGVNLLTERFGGLEWIDCVSITDLNMATISNCVGAQLAVTMAPDRLEKAKVAAYTNRFYYFVVYMTTGGVRTPETSYGMTWTEENGFEVESWDDFDESNREIFGNDLEWTEEERYRVMTQLWIDHIARLHCEVYGTNPEGYEEIEVNRSARMLEMMEEAQS